MQNIPDQTISGLNSEELSWVSDESVDRLIKELDPEIFKDVEYFTENCEYSKLTREIEAELDEAEKSAVPKSTFGQTKIHIKKFKNFLIEKGLSPNIETMPTRFLADYLRYFYFNLRCQDGTFYSPRSLVCYRASIQRYLTSPEVNRTVNILKDSEFNRANGVLKAMVGKWIKEGNKGKKYPAIEPEDLNRIRNYFDRSNPDSLQHEVWFNITYYFGLRGREIVCQLSKGDLEIDSDSDGRTFISLKKDFLSKNVKCSLSQKEFETVSVARMYANDSCSSKCPVECLKLYFDKIPPENPHLFPPSVTNWEKSVYWYVAVRKIGKDRLGKFMKEISTRACLSKPYTNHSVRVTVVTELHSRGYSNTDICNVTGHKNPNSIARYIRETRDESRRQMSLALNQGLNDPSNVTITRKRFTTEISTNNGCENCQKKMKIETNAPINITGNIQNCYIYNNGQQS